MIYTVRCRLAWWLNAMAWRMMPEPQRTIEREKCRGQLSTEEFVKRIAQYEARGIPIGPAPAR